jgi:hypothetical protein
MFEGFTIDPVSVQMVSKAEYSQNVCRRVRITRKSRALQVSTLFLELLDTILRELDTFLFCSTEFGIRGSACCPYASFSRPRRVDDQGEF